MKKKVFLIVLIVLLIIFGSMAIIIKNNNREESNNNCINVASVLNFTGNQIDNNINQDTITENKDIITENDDIGDATKDFLENYDKAEDFIVVKVGNYEITKQSICVTKYFYREIENLVEKEIENIVLTDLAKKNNITITKEDEAYINDVVEQARNEIKNSNIFQEINITEEEYLELIKNYMKNISIIQEYKDMVRDEIENGTLEVKDSNLQKDCENFLIEYAEWEKNKDIEKYKEILELQDDILEKYIEYQINQFEVVIY